MASAICPRPVGMVLTSVHSVPDISQSCPGVRQTVALDPRYGTRKTQEFVCGGAAGQLLLSSRVIPDGLLLRSALSCCWPLCTAAPPCQTVCSARGGTINPVSLPSGGPE